MSKPRSAANKAVIRGQRNDRLHLIPATTATMMKLAQGERVFFAGLPITELGARCILQEARRNKQAYVRSRKSVRAADYEWRWRPGGPGRKPKIVARVGEKERNFGCQRLVSG